MLSLHFIATVHVQSLTHLCSPCVQTVPHLFNPCEVPDLYCQCPVSNTSHSIQYTLCTLSISPCPVSNTSLKPMSSHNPMSSAYVQLLSLSTAHFQRVMTITSRCMCNSIFILHYNVKLHLDQT